MVSLSTHGPSAVRCTQQLSDTIDIVLQEGNHMIQRALGVTIGGLVTLILLLIMVPASPTWQDYLAPLVIGNVAAFFWPVVIAFWLGRRVKNRRDQKIEDEVQRQVDAQK
jgi:hypothetical protein